jgi:hypothetical protein
LIADIIFIIYIYQRWIYRVDPKRVNEFGTSGDMTDQPPVDPALVGAQNGVVHAIEDSPLTPDSPDTEGTALAEDTPVTEDPSHAAGDPAKAGSPTPEAAATQSKHSTSHRQKSKAAKKKD